MDQDQALLLLFCCFVAFVSGYGARAMVSRRRRREALKAREMHERMMQAKASQKSNNLMHHRRP
jgi:hypothetical protein